MGRKKQRLRVREAKMRGEEQWEIKDQGGQEGGERKYWLKPILKKRQSITIDDSVNQEQISVGLIYLTPL